MERWQGKWFILFLRTSPVAIVAWVNDTLGCFSVRIKGAFGKGCRREKVGGQLVYGGRNTTDSVYVVLRAARFRKGTASCLLRVCFLLLFGARRSRSEAGTNQT